MNMGDVVLLKELIHETKKKTINKQSVSFRCDANVLKRLQDYSKKHNISLSTLINNICTEGSVKYES